MPEGPEVKTITDWLCKNFTLCKIVNNSKFIDINAGTINKIHCKGKQIFFCITNATGEKVYLNSRLALMGKWSLTEGNHTRFWMKLQKSTCSEELMLYNDDTMNFGDIELHSEEKYQDKLTKIGPDLLSDDIDISLWIKKIKNGRIKNKMIYDYLTEQKYFSGIGNYLKSEILYRSKILPTRTLCSLSDVEISELYKVSIATIKESYSYGGLTIKTYWSPEGTRGTFPIKVYQKDKDENGFKVISSKIGGPKDQTTFWVPEIQK